MAYKYGTDKCPEIGHSYTDFYYDMFVGKRESVKKLLEIGVGSRETMPRIAHYTRGASLYMWRDFFPNAKIYGIDTDKNAMLADGRIQTFLYDQSDPAQLTELISVIGNDLDIVIDDGSHDPNHQIISCRTLMPLLNRDVVYVIEDTSTRAATAVIRGLADYNCHSMRRSRMRTHNDRLIVVSNK